MVHLIGFAVEIYYDAQPYERQLNHCVFKGLDYIQINRFHFPSSPLTKSSKSTILAYIFRKQETSL